MSSFKVVSCGLLVLSFLFFLVGFQIGTTINDSFLMQQSRELAPVIFSDGTANLPGSATFQMGMGTTISMSSLLLSGTATTNNITLKNSAILKTSDAKMAITTGCK